MPLCSTTTQNHGKVYIDVVNINLGTITMCVAYNTDIATKFQYQMDYKVENKHTKYSRLTGGNSSMHPPAMRLRHKSDDYLELLILSRCA